jgi:hypothetical protein
VDNGQLVTAPQPSPTGQGMVDPKDGMQLMKQTEWLISHGPGAAAGSNLGGPKQLIPEGMGTISPIMPAGSRLPGRPGRSN